MSERSSTSDWMFASVTSITAAEPAGLPGSPAGVPPGDGVAVEVSAGAGVRSALRSTAPRVKIDEVIRGSLMVV